MSQLRAEIDGIRAREIHLADPYEPKDPDGLLRMVFMIPYGHAFSLMGNGPMGLHDLINRTKEVPAVAERALHYERLVRGGTARPRRTVRPTAASSRPYPLAQRT